MKSRETLTRFYMKVLVKEDEIDLVVIITTCILNELKQCIA